MAKDFIGYEALVESALRGVVREALKRVEEQGLIGGHHFFITYKTRFPGVEMPDFLREQYPEEITIVLQNKFWGLKVGDEAFEVTLTFQKIPASFACPLQPYRLCRWRHQIRAPIRPTGRKAAVRGEQQTARPRGRIFAVRRGRDPDRKPGCQPRQVPQEMTACATLSATPESNLL